MRTSIVLVGNYGHGNLGDEAILEGFLDSTERVRPEHLPITVLTDDLSDTASRLSPDMARPILWRSPFGRNVSRIPLILAEVVGNVRRARNLVLAGGGLINDSNPTSLVLYSFSALVSALTRTRLHAIAISVGPLDSTWSRLLGRWLLGRCVTVWVRDTISLKAARQLGRADARMIPDAAFALGTLVKNRAPMRKPDGRTTVALSVIPLGLEGLWYRADGTMYYTYVERMQELIHRLVSDTGRTVLLVAINVAGDRRAILDVVSGLPDEIADDVRISESKTPKDLVAEIQDVEMVVASRLHAAVLASVAGIPFLTLAYQAKVSAYAQDAGFGDFVFDVHDFSTEEVLDAIGQLGGERLERQRSLAECALARATEFDLKWRQWLDVFSP